MTKSDNITFNRHRSWGAPHEVGSSLHTGAQPNFDQKHGDWIKMRIAATTTLLT
jgi:hypothetical protein